MTRGTIFQLDGMQHEVARVEGDTAWYCAARVAGGGGADSEMRCEDAELSRLVRGVRDAGSWAMWIARGARGVPPLAAPLCRRRRARRCWASSRASVSRHASFRGTDDLSFSRLSKRTDDLSFSRLSKRLVRSFRMRDHGQTRSPALLLEFATSVAQTTAHAIGLSMAHPPDIARRPASSRRVAPARPPSFSGRASVPMPSLRRRRDRRQQYSTESDEADRLMTQ